METEFEIINRRNIVALNDAINLHRSKHDHMSLRLENAFKSIAQLQAEMAELRVQLANILNQR